MIKRVISSVVLLPPVLAAIWFAYPYFDLLIGAAIVVLAWEWDKMTSNRLTIFALINTALAISAMLMIEDVFTLSIFAVLTGIVAISAYIVAVKFDAPYPLIKMFAPIYLTMFSVSAVFFEYTFGALAVYWLIFTVFAADIGGMAFGCTIKGPKLCPTISPQKTWSGFLGSILFSIAVSVSFGLLFEMGQTSSLIINGVIIAVVALFGDLLESKIKRAVGVKDSSSIIPGHGGVFDRLDSLMLVLIVASSIAIIAGKGVLL